MASINCDMGEGFGRREMADISCIPSDTPNAVAEAVRAALA
jgi:hypothetical protein